MSKKYTPKCDCKELNKDNERCEMIETKSSDGLTCDYCGYTVYRDYNANATNDHVVRSSRRPRSLVSSWHRRDR